MSTVNRLLSVLNLWKPMAPWWRRSWGILLLGLVWSLGMGLGSGAALALDLGDPSAVVRALAMDDRPAADQSQDLIRHPEDFLEFCAIEPGMTVVDVMGGTGYYTEILSHLVGAGGQVYLQNEIEGWPWAKFFPPALAERFRNDRLSNVTRLDTPLEAMGLPAHQVDRVILVKFFHDLVWMGIDRPQVLAQLREALKPGGKLCLQDHRAVPGAGTTVAQTLHRIDPWVVVAEVTGAGFTLDDRSDAYRNPADDGQTIVFDPSIRGNTDQFLFRFSLEASHQS